MAPSSDSSGVATQIEYAHFLSTDAGARSTIVLGNDLTGTLIRVNPDHSSDCLKISKRVHEGEKADSTRYVLYLAVVDVKISCARASATRNKIRILLRAADGGR